MTTCVTISCISSLCIRFDHKFAKERLFYQLQPNPNSKESIKFSGKFIVINHILNCPCQISLCIVPE